MFCNCFDSFFVLSYLLPFYILLSFWWSYLEDAYLLYTLTSMWLVSKSAFYIGKHVFEDRPIFGFHSPLFKFYLFLSNQSQTWISAHIQNYFSLLSTCFMVPTAIPLEKLVSYNNQSWIEVKTKIFLFFLSFILAPLIWINEQKTGFISNM